MPLKSDLTIDWSKLQDSAISEQTRTCNDALMKVAKAEPPKWWEVGAEKYRQMRWNGETPMPRPTVLDSAKNITLPSREPHRQIPCRVFHPKANDSKGIFCHIHGGGWVLQSEAYQDNMLQHYADHSSLNVISVGYRLAPEHPYPAGNEDCVDIAEHLIAHGMEEFGGPLLFMGGDSAGAHLSVLTCFRLLQTRPDFALRGLVLNFGAYDISGCLPQVHHFDLPLILDGGIMARYIDAYLPNKTPEERRDMWISPFFANLTKMKLPPAMFSVGTLDVLLDDSVMMATKWAMSPAEAILKLYPGAPHNFTCFSPSGTERTEECLLDIATFMNERMA